jgi:uncharacterized protein (TIGR02145 family)
MNKSSFSTFVILLTILIINSCAKEKVDFPILTTKTAYDITPDEAVSGGEVTEDGGAPVTSRGICWSTSHNPTVEDSKKIVSGTTGDFTCDLDQLTPGTLYFIRAFAGNSAGTGYGNEVSFTTLEPDPATVTDADGNSYHVSRFGTQLWMRENLKTTKWPDGTLLTFIDSDFSWGGLSGTSKAYCWLNDNAANKDTYGALYTWAAAKGACPTGWHLPADEEWEKLITFLGGTNAAGGNLRDSWNGGFSALPGGTRTAIGSFFGGDRFGYWWTSTPFDPGNAWNFYLDFNSSTLFKGSRYNYEGNSVRCLRDH